MDTRYPIVAAIADLARHVLSYPEAFPPSWGQGAKQPRRCGVGFRVLRGTDGKGITSVLSTAPIGADSSRTAPAQHASAHGKLAWKALQTTVPAAAQHALDLSACADMDGFSFSLVWSEGSPHDAVLRAQWIRTPGKRSRWHTHTPARAIPVSEALDSLQQRCAVLACHPAGDRLWWAGEKRFTSLVQAPDAASARLLSHALWHNQMWDHVVVNEAFFPTPYPNPFVEDLPSRIGAAQAVIDAYQEVARCLKHAARRWEPAVYGSLVLQHKIDRSEQAIQRQNVSMDFDAVIAPSLSYNGKPLDKAPHNCLTGLDQDALSEAMGLGWIAVHLLADIPAIGMAPLDVEQWFHVHPGGDDVFMGLNFSRHDQTAFSNGLGDFHTRDFPRIWGPRLARLEALGRPTHFWHVHTDSRGTCPIVAAANAEDALRAATLFWHPEPESDRRHPDAPPKLSHTWQVARLVSASERDAPSPFVPVEEAA